MKAHVLRTMTATRIYLTAPGGQKLSLFFPEGVVISATSEEQPKQVVGDFAELKQK